MANQPINKTLRLDRRKSVGRDGTPGNIDTENIYIEGDNLDALKLLQETYLGKVKMIYIDPPYNTGNDFIYDDDFSQGSEEYFANSGQTDDEGNRLVRNEESNGRFHTDWLNMIYPRLKLSRDLLSDDGVLFISIGQDEIHNLINIANEVFGEVNHISTISRVMKSGGAQGQFFSPNIEYIVVYAKQISMAGNFREAISEDVVKKLYTSIEDRVPRNGEKYRPFGLYQSSLDPLRGCSNQRYFIEAPDGELLIPPGDAMPQVEKDGESVTPLTSNDKVWRWSRDRYLEEKRKGNVVIKPSKGVLINSQGRPAKWNVYTKIWLSERQSEGALPVDLITKWENRQSKKELQSIDIPFEFAKPVELIKYLFSIVSDTKNSTIIDFFSGSATTAAAVMQLNGEDKGNRKFIMVQLPEKCSENSEAYKVGYKTICEIGEERIRRAGMKIREENPDTNLDIGFRVFKVDSSNMKDVYYKSAEYKQEQIDLFTDNIREDRTPEDLLFQVMLDLGISLSSKIEESVINKKKVFVVGGEYTTLDGSSRTHLIACFDKDITDDTVKAIAEKHPSYAVFRDSCMANDSVATNFEQIFETYSPDTVRKVL